MIASHLDEEIISASASKTAAFMTAFSSALFMRLIRAFAPLLNFIEHQLEVITRACQFNPTVTPPVLFAFG